MESQLIVSIVKNHMNISFTNQAFKLNTSMNLTLLDQNLYMALKDFKWITDMFHLSTDIEPIESMVKIINEYVKSDTEITYHIVFKPEGYTIKEATAKNISVNIESLINKFI